MGIFGQKEVVAFDFETTGVDPGFDRIIEIGAVKVFDDGRQETFKRLVNPQRPVPFYVKQLTGIDDSMLSEAEPIELVLPQFLDFLGDALLIGHNVSFDLGFLFENCRALGLRIPRNRVVDTLSLARVLYPTAVNHQLETLAALFEVELVRAHRAYYDALATLGVAEKLWQKLLSLPEPLFDQLEELIFAAGASDLEFYWRLAREHRMFRENLPPPPEVDSDKLVVLQNELGEPTSESVDFDPDIIEAYFSENSPLGTVLKNFKVRSQQQDMAAAVTQAFIDGELLMVEAGTGVGKSFAYLVPALFWSAANGEKVVVSTYTKALQEQLFFKDLPVLRKVLPFDFYALLLKGKGNYICLYRLERYMRDPMSLTSREREGLIYIASWISETESGDISENTSFINNFRYSLWEKVRADGHTCIGKLCPYYRDCFVYKIRRKISEAQMLIVNHALLISDLGGAILGDYSYLIVDEAHKLDVVAVELLGGEISIWRVKSVLDGIYKEAVVPSGVLSYIMTALGDQSLDEQFERIKENISFIRECADKFFSELALNMELIYHWQKQKYQVRKRYDYINPVYKSIKDRGDELIAALKSLYTELDIFIDNLGEPQNEELRKYFEELKGERAKLMELMDDLLVVLSPDEPDVVYWMESPTSPDSIDARLCWAPLDVGQVLNTELYERLGAAVFTSATLAIAEDFSYYLERLGLVYAPRERVRTLLLGSPYDYETQLRIVVTEFMPSPRELERFIDKTSALVRETSRKFRKGTMVLFTSHDSLRQIYETLYYDFQQVGIKLLGQGFSGSLAAISRTFIEDVESVLLGTESFWQGIDIPGKSLELLILTKLPFPVPDDPYIEAMSERLQRCGRRPFEEFIVPQAVIRFRQGVGRLIRSETDRGVLAILDKRIITMRYGEKFISSLPKKPEIAKSLDEVYQIVAEHLS